jgi:hypothetical protein
VLKPSYWLNKNESDVIYIPWGSYKIPVIHFNKLIEMKIDTIKNRAARKVYKLKDIYDLKLLQEMKT